MTYPTTDVRIEAGPFGFFAKGCHPDTRLKSRGNWPAYLAAQAHKLAGVGPVNGWDRAGSAQGRLPGGAKQAAFFMVAAAIVVAKEIFTFRTGWGFHIFNAPQACGTFYLYTRVR
jgi:hypothetical protein